MNPLSERATLERAMVAIEEVLARAADGTGPGLAPDPSAQEALAMGLAAAAALVDVSQTLLRTLEEPATDGRAREWRALVTHAERASRWAHRMAVLLATQKSIPEPARSAAAPDAKLPRGPAPVQGRSARMTFSGARD